MNRRKLYLIAMLFATLGFVSCEEKEVLTCPTGIENGYEWVDLGLPSGLKWATRNVGASSPEDFGDYYAWGDTIVREKYIPGDYYYEKYDSIFSFEDVVKTKVKGNWRMPTEEEMEELEKNCTWKWITQNGVNGYKVIGPNGNFIFLPATGYYSFNGSREYEDVCYCWSSSLRETDPSLAYGMSIIWGINGYSEIVAVGAWDAIARGCGLPIRGVCE